jgi:hypothetical protein
MAKIHKPFNKALFPMTKYQQKKCILWFPLLQAPYNGEYLYYLNYTYNCECPMSCLRIWLNEFGCTQIYNMKVSSGTHSNILRFYISIYYWFFMKILNAQKNTPKIKSWLVIVTYSYFSQKIKKVSSFYVLQQ